MAESLSFSVVSGKTNKINKYILFGVNTLFLVLYLIRHYSLIGMISFAVLSLILFFVMCRSDDRLPAAAYIPFIILFDALIYIGINFEALRTAFRFSDFWDVIKSFNWVVLVICIIGIFEIIVGLGSKRPSSSAIGGGLFLNAFVLRLWSNCDIKAFKFLGEGGFVFGISLTAALIWIVICVFIENAAPDKNKGTTVIGILLTILAVLFVCTVQPYIRRMLPEWQVSFYRFPKGAFAYWRVIAVFILGIAGAVVLSGFEAVEYKYLTADTYAVIILSEGLFFFRILMNIYFTHNWILLIFLVFSVLHHMKKDYIGEFNAKYKINHLVFLVLEFLAFILAAVLIRNGLWLNLIISIVFGIYFVNEITRNTVGKHAVGFWNMILFCIFAETAAYLWRRHFSLSGLLLLAAAFAGSIIAMQILNGKNPVDAGPDKRLRSAVCLAFGLVAILSLVRFGIGVKTSYFPDKEQVSVEFSTKGDNILTEAYAYRRDNLGRKDEKTTLRTKGQNKLDLSKGTITVAATNKKGIEKSVVIWYPYWQINYEKVKNVK